MAISTAAGTAMAAPVEMVLATAGQDTSARTLIPGGLATHPDARFSNFNNKVYRSPTNNQWAVVATTTGSVAPAAAVDQVLVIGSGLTGTVRAQEGVTEFSPGLYLNFSRVDVPRINDAGQWAMTFRPAFTGATSTDEKVVRWNGTSFDVVATSGTPIAALPGQTFSGSFTGGNITNAGEVGFLGAIAPATGGNDSAFAANGSVLLAEMNVTVPTGQDAGSGNAAWADIDSNVFFQSADGAHWIALGEVGFITSFDKVAVVDGEVVIQEGAVIHGSPFTSPASSISDVWMESNGDWFARGSNADGIDWVVRNGVVIAFEGQPVVPGATETWQTFRAMRGNNRGDYIVNGNATGDEASDDYVVLNGQRILAREADQIDFDGNGVLDDSVYLHTILDHGVLNNDSYYYFVTRLKNAPTATAGFGTTPLNASFVRVLACPADFNDSGGVTVQDIFDFLASYFSNAPLADFNRSGAVTVQDIFDYLAAYFLGC